MRDFVNARAASLKPSGIRKFFDIVQKTEGAISLGVGEPDFITPYNVREAAIRSIQKGLTQYTGNRGLSELCLLASEYLKVRFNVNYPADRILITVGASEGIDLALRAVCDVGDEILIPEPSYVSYSPAVILAGGVPVPVKCSAENDFILISDIIEKAVTERTKAIIIPYPNNPTGAIMTEDELKAIVPVIKKHDLLVISDEIYAELTYGRRHFSIASIDDMSNRTILLNGFSKAFAMTGWRVGFACAPKQIDEAMFKIHQYTMLCAPQPSQRAAICALKDGLADGFSTVEKMRLDYERRGLFLANSFNSLGLTCFKPKGAFYVFPRIESLGLDGDEFAAELLKRYKVAVVPGSAFGEGGKLHVRASYATSLSQLATAIDRITRFVNEIKAER